MREIQGAPEGVGGFAEFEDDDAAAGFGHALHFRQAGLPARQVAQAVTHGHGVEGVVWEGDVHGVALDEEGVVGAFALNGHAEHGGAEIQPGDLGAAPGEGEGQIAGAAAQVQGAGAGPDRRQIDHPAFPQPVQAEALQVVDQIVTPGDGAEEVVDLRRPLFAGSVKSVAHTPSLA